MPVENPQSRPHLAKLQVVIHTFKVEEGPIGEFDQRLSTSVLLPPCFPRISKPINRTRRKRASQILEFS